MINKDEIKIGQFSLSYNNEQMTKEIIHEIFHEKIYDFKTDKKAPLIIDAGSNIGVATIFFKYLYPQAQILCFEPDPNSFALLKKNVTNNCLRDVTLVNAALAAQTGTVEFYGQINADTPYSCGNSIIKSWGEQRSICDIDYLRKNTIQVPTVQLSTYINAEVDFLKLDIEGAERQVIDELGDKLELVKILAMEVHCIDDPKFINHLKGILSALKKYSFHVDIVQKDVAKTFPVQTTTWVKKTKPKLFELKACRVAKMVKKSDGFSYPKQTTIYEADQLLL
jgi:FkbM family methyltransferase